MTREEWFKKNIDRFVGGKFETIVKAPDNESEQNE